MLCEITSRGLNHASHQSKGCSSLPIGFNVILFEFTLENRRDTQLLHSCGIGGKFGGATQCLGCFVSTLKPFVNRNAQS